MPFVPTTGGVRISMDYEVEGQQCANVFHVRADTPSDVSTLEGITTVFYNWWNTNVKPKQHSACVLERIVATNLDDISGPQFIRTAGLPASGTNGSAALSNNVTIATTLTTSRIGRSFRGRSYWCGLTPDDLLDVNHITLAAAAALSAAFDLLIEALATNGTPLAILSLVANGAPRSEGVLTNVTAVHTDNTIDSQRRRLPGRGA